MASYAELNHAPVESNTGHINSAINFAITPISMIFIVTIIVVSIMISMSVCTWLSVVERI